MSTLVGRRVPWRVMRWLNVHWPRAFQLLQYGIPNVNTAAHWDDAWRRHGQDGFRATGEIWPVRERVLAEVPPGARVLDVGCGVGEMLELLHERHGCDCHGVDIAPAAVAAVRARGFHAEATTLPVIPHPDAAFDVVVCTETLEHVTDARATLHEIRRVLRPGGRLLLSVPDGTVDEEEAHVHRFTAAKLERALAAEFADVRVERISDEAEPTLFASARG